MKLRIEIRETEVNEWNEKHNLENYEFGDFSKEVYEIVSKALNITDEYWDNYQAWYDKILTVEYDVEEIDTTSIITKIENALEKNMEIEIEKINIL